jgi:uncharacterized protein YlxP (DUF503 family)
MATVTKKLIFIKPGGQLVAMMDSDQDISSINTEKFSIKTVELDLDQGEYWLGDYDNGSIQRKTDKPVVLESAVKFNTNVKILEQYPVHQQLNIIIDMLAQSDIPQTAEFTAMKEFIDTARTTHQGAISQYKNNPDTYTFVSSEDDDAQANAVKTFE